jgi:hypothetical protein
MRTGAVKTGFGRAYGVALSVFQAGWSDCIY